MKLGNRLSYFLKKRGASGSEPGKRIRICIAPRIQEAIVRYKTCGDRNRL